ncbi:MAG: type II secretion system protein GspG [Planctomycetota bacterium]
MSQSSRPQDRSAATAGFTLVEVIVVLAVVLLLTGIAVPMISGYMDDGRRARAEAELKVLASAVTSFYKDVGVWPARSSAGTNNTLYVLCTGTTVPTTNQFSNNNALNRWLMDGTHGDTLDNHLLSNTPGGATGGAYPTTGAVRWRGPYTAGSSPLDPWGRPYLVTVRSGTSTSTSNYKRLYVLSAGPNGRIDTVANLTATTDLAGDDLGVIISQRQ